MLEATTAERLVRLRLMLASAVSAASDTTQGGRHAAVIALDGVVELALGLAFHHRNLSVKRDGFHEHKTALREDLAGTWTPRGEQGVNELHRARNSAHHGLLPAAHHIPTWTANVEQFVGSLVGAAFIRQTLNDSAIQQTRDEFGFPLEAAEAALVRRRDATAEAGEDTQTAEAARAPADYSGMYVDYTSGDGVIHVGYKTRLAENLAEFKSAFP